MAHTLAGAGYPSAAAVGFSATSDWEGGLYAPGGGGCGPARYASIAWHSSQSLTGQGSGCARVQVHVSWSDSGDVQERCASRPHLLILTHVSSASNSELLLGASEARRDAAGQTLLGRICADCHRLVPR